MKTTDVIKTADPVDPLAVIGHEWWGDSGSCGITMWV